MAQPDAPDAPAPAEAARRLIDAIRAGDEGRVEAALRDGASVDTSDSAGCTALMLAILKGGRTRIAKLLLARGADVHRQHPSGARAVHAAAQVGDAELVAALAEAGANVATPNNIGATPALIAAQNGHVEVLRLLADLGANVNTPKHSGATPAYIAAQNGHLEVVRLLAELGANIETPH